jgi:alkylation response protein AidB-like acyl-CoA dehydrogenase
VIREHHAEAERELHLSPPVLAALHDAGLLRLCTPRALGGLEAGPLTRALAIEEISGHDTAAGWTLANPLDQAYLVLLGELVPKRLALKLANPLDQAYLVLRASAQAKLAPGGGAPMHGASCSTRPCARRGKPPSPERPSR